MDITTAYLGLKLRTPLVPSASPLTLDGDNIKLMEDAGAPAVVFHSLFEEQAELSMQQSALNVLTNRSATAPLGQPASLAFKPLGRRATDLESLILAHRPEAAAAERNVSVEQAKLQLPHRAWIPDPQALVEARHLLHNPHLRISEIACSCTPRRVVIALMRAFCIKLPRLRRVLVAILLAHLLAVMAMAASPALHEWVHWDANDRDHDCAVVLFMAGGADAAVVVVLVVAVLATSGSQAMPRGEWVEGIFRVLRILEHAPPTAS